MPKLAQVNFLPTAELWRHFRSAETHLGGVVTLHCELTQRFGG